MSVKLALTGNPNSGKTTMFNYLTGSSAYVGNWPGVTVEKKEGKLKGHKEVTITDLPGIYSLSPYTLEEVITRDYIMNERPDVVLNLVDASNIERNLYLTTQLLEMGAPVVIALNMIDIIEKSGERIDTKKLSQALGCPVVETSALKGTGMEALIETALKAVGKPQQALHRFDPSVERALSEIGSLIADSAPQSALRWFSVKMFERDEKATAQLSVDASARARIEEIVKSCEQAFDDDSEGIITNERYVYIADVTAQCVSKKRQALTTSDRIDRVVTNRWLAIPIFALVMWFVYFVSVSSLGSIVTDWTNDTLFGEMIMPAVSGWLEHIGASDWLIGLIVDGCIGGVGAVLGFVPQMLILFFFLSILEDCGYMARIAFIMDRIFRKFGLSGKSFIPMLISSGCGVPGIMASRTIENEKDRKMTIMITTFIPCGAKLPIIALIGGALFDGASWVAPAMYFLGVGVVILSGVILKKTKLFAGDPAPFVMELPRYRLPGIRGVLTHMWERGRAFIVKAGTVIFVACGVIWFLSNFGFTGGRFGMAGEEASLLAAAGSAIAPIFAPLGFGNWRATVATITGLVAKENVVATFGVLFGLGEVMEDDPALLTSVATMFTTVSAMSFMVFNLICAPCFAAIGAIKREMGGWKWTWIALGYQTGLAYVLAFITYQLGSVFFLGASFGVGAILALAALGALLYFLFRSYKPGDIKTKAARAKASV